LLRSPWFSQRQRRLCRPRRFTGRMVLQLKLRLAVVPLGQELAASVSPDRSFVKRADRYAGVSFGTAASAVGGCTATNVDETAALNFAAHSPPTLLAANLSRSRSASLKVFGCRLMMTARRIRGRRPQTSKGDATCLIQDTNSRASEVATESFLRKQSVSAFRVMLDLECWLLRLRQT
jgi:hypothetical protein